jgi:hypothetical protein
LDNAALYARVIFPPLAVHGLVEPLGDMEPVHDGSSIGQQTATSLVERLAHIRPVGLHLPPLLFRQLLQTLASWRF